MLNGEKLKGHILILITNILFAINMPISKYLLPSHVQPEALTIMRMGVCLPVVLVNFVIYQTGKGDDKRPGTAFLSAPCAG